jgi:hypothetical protein
MSRVGQEINVLADRVVLRHGRLRAIASLCCCSEVVVMTYVSQQSINTLSCCNKHSLANMPSSFCAGSQQSSTFRENHFENA